MTYSEISKLFQLDPSSKYGIVPTDPAMKFRTQGTSRSVRVTVCGESINLRNIAWMLYNKCEVPDSKRVRPKNGCPTDYSESNLIIVPVGTRLAKIGAKSMKSWVKAERAKPKPSKPKVEPVLLPSTFNYLLRYLEPFTELEYYRTGVTLIVHPTETNEYVKISRTADSDEDITESDRRFLLLNSRVAPDELIYRQFNTRKMKQINIRDKSLLEQYLV